ncbi:MAG: hypothetical protein NTU65_05490 [Cyanobacteria bacterium]|nr:hypothetical protein [Cyanobacteriota bacterium]
MADETNASIQSASPQGQQDGGFRGGRQGGGREGGREGGRDGAREGGGREGGNREPGGFRIRLSENELRAARAIQEAFGLRSTVAALGLSLRTVAQLLEDGQLAEIVAAHRAQAGARPEGGRSEGRREPRGAGPAGGRGDRPAGNSRPNPFARPSKPAAVVEAPAEEPADEPAAAEALGSDDEAPALGTETAADAADQAPAAEAAPEEA